MHCQRGGTRSIQIPHLSTLLPRLENGSPRFRTLVGATKRRAIPTGCALGGRTLGAAPCHMIHTSGAYNTKGPYTRSMFQAKAMRTTRAAADPSYTLKLRSLISGSEAEQLALGHRELRGRERAAPVQGRQPLEFRRQPSRLPAKLHQTNPVSPLVNSKLPKPAISQAFKCIVL